MDINLDEGHSVVYVKPTMALKVADFSEMSAVVDPFIAQHGDLQGVVVETAKFPGWENFNAFKAHVKFIKDHSSKVQKIALVTNSNFAGIAEKCIGPFVKTKIKHFAYDQLDSAKQWIEN